MIFLAKVKGRVNIISYPDLPKTEWDLGTRLGLANFTPFAGMGHLISEPKFKIPPLPPLPPC